MATETPSTATPRVRFFDVHTNELVWTSSTDAPDVIEEAKAELATLDAGEWITASVDFGLGWRTRWAGRVRLVDGELECRPAADLLAFILNPPNPVVPDANE